MLFSKNGTFWDILGHWLWGQGFTTQRAAVQIHDLCQADVRQLAPVFDAPLLQARHIFRGNSPFFRVFTRTQKKTFKIALFSPTFACDGRSHVL